MIASALSRFLGLMIFFRLLRKERLMSDLPSAPAVAAQTADTPVPAAAAAPTIDPAKVVTSVVQTVKANPGVDPANAAGVITSILAGLYQAEPAIFALSRAGARTQAEVSLGLGLAEIIVGAFLRPAS
jgi:hypothetical protein